MKNRRIVKQDFRLINARYKLTTNEIKLILLVLAQIDIDDCKFYDYKVKVSDIDKSLLSFGYTRLKNFTKSIMSKPLVIDTDWGFQTFNWFSSIHYYEKTGFFTLRISDDLKPYLLDLKKRFIKYNLKYILPLSSSYSIRLYQLLKEYEKLTKRTFTVEELQDILQVPKSLKRYDNFKRKVLKVAEKELVEHCDIFFEFEEIKQGRKITEILFRIKKNTFIKDDNLLFDTSSKFDFYIGKHVLTKDGLKNILYIEDYKDFLKINYDDGSHSKVDNIKMLDKIIKD